MLNLKMRIIMFFALFLAGSVNLSHSSFSEDDYKSSAVQKASTHKNKKRQLKEKLQRINEAVKKHNAFSLPLAQAHLQDLFQAQDTTESPIKKAVSDRVAQPIIEEHADLELAPMDAIERESPSSDNVSAAAQELAPAEDEDYIDALIQATIKAELNSLNERLKAFSCRYLSTHEEHQAHLLKSIRAAKSSILITSWGCYLNDQNSAELVHALQEATYRGVKAYLYYQKGKDISSLRNFGNIKQNQLNIHAKVLMVDNALTLGSYDWLQDPSWAPSGNESICLDPSICGDFKDEIWSMVKSYRALSFNAHKVRSFESRFDRTDPLCIQPAHDHSVTLLTTPLQHRDRFRNALEIARSRIIFTVFSVTKDQELLRDFLPLELVVGCLNRRVSVTIIYNSAQNREGGALDQYFSFLDPYYRRQISLMPMPGIHQKTLIVDDNTYMMGSYNLLSSADTLLDKYTYMETSVIFHGSAARLLIQQFEQKYPKAGE